MAPVIMLGDPSSSKSNALLLQNRPPAIVLLATAITPLIAAEMHAAVDGTAFERNGGRGRKNTGAGVAYLTAPLMRSPAQSISSAPKISSAAPFATNPPLIVEPHAISIPPSLTRTPPDMFAPPRTQKSPALTTTPPTTVPESGGLGAGPVLHVRRRQCPAAETRQCQTHHPHKK